MGTVKNLTNHDAIEQIKKIAKDIDICLFCTNTNNGIPFETRPMSTQDVDDEGNIWFLSNRQSNKNQEIKQDDQVQLLYADNSSSTYMTVNGHADAFRDQAKIEEFWNPIIKAWFEKGKEDPDITIIRVRPDDAYYWDTKSNKFVSMLKIVAAAVSGKTMDDGIEGKMEL